MNGRQILNLTAFFSARWPWFGFIFDQVALEGGAGVFVVAVAVRLFLEEGFR